MNYVMIFEGGRVAGQLTLIVLRRTRPHAAKAVRQLTLVLDDIQYQRIQLQLVGGVTVRWRTKLSEDAKKRSFQGLNRDCESPHLGENRITHVMIVCHYPIREANYERPQMFRGH